MKRVAQTTSTTKTTTKSTTTKTTTKSTTTKTTSTSTTSKTTTTSTTTKMTTKSTTTKMSTTSSTATSTTTTTSASKIKKFRVEYLVVVDYSTRNFMLTLYPNITYLNGYMNIIFSSIVKQVIKPIKRSYK